jgi:hypothetical protein
MKSANSQAIFFIRCTEIPLQSYNPWGCFDVCTTK